MNFCINPNYLIDTTVQAEGFVDRVISQLNPAIFKNTIENGAEEAKRAVDDLIDVRFPLGGPFIDLFQDEVAQTVLFVLWDDMVDDVRKNLQKLTIQITTENEGEVNERRCYRFITTPLTDDEIGQEPPPDMPEPENPFEPPPDVNPDDGGEPPTVREPRQPSPSPGERQPQPDQPPRIPPPPVTPIPPSQEEPEPEPEPEPPTIPGGNQPDINVDVDVNVDVDLDELKEQLEEIRETIERESQADREIAREQHKQLQELIEQLDLDITINQEISTEEIRDLLDQIEIELTSIVEVETTNLEEAINRLGDEISNFESFGALADAIGVVGREIVEAIDRNTNDGIKAIDQTLSKFAVDLIAFGEGLGEELTADAEKLRKQLSDEFSGFQTFISELLSFGDPSEILDWICQMIQLFQQIADHCGLGGERR